MQDLIDSKYFIAISYDIMYIMSSKKKNTSAPQHNINEIDNNPKREG